MCCITKLEKRGIQGLLNGGHTGASTNNEKHMGNILGSLSPGIQGFCPTRRKEGVWWAFLAILPISVLAAVDVRIGKCEY